MDFQFYTSKEVKEMFKISDSTFRRAMNKGELKGFTLAGSDLRFSREDIQEYINKNRRKPR